MRTYKLPFDFSTIYLQLVAQLRFSTFSFLITSTYFCTYVIIVSDELQGFPHQNHIKYLPHQIHQHRIIDTVRKPHIRTSGDFKPFLLLSAQRKFLFRHRIPLGKKQLQCGQKILCVQERDVYSFQKTITSLQDRCVNRNGN